MRSAVGGFMERLRRRRRGEVGLLTSGWDRYARRFAASGSADPLGEEWTRHTFGYGLSETDAARFDDYLVEAVLDRWLPREAAEGLEIGPGGGRLTRLLLGRAKVLHLGEPSRAMLAMLERRFAGEPSLRFHKTDGKSLPPLAPASLGFVIAFDVFVHFEPRLVFWYLRQIAAALAPGGRAILHYANPLTELGWQKFLHDLDDNLEQRTRYSAFGVMSPALMAKFAREAGLEVLTEDSGAIPRDSLAILERSARP